MKDNPIQKISIKSWFNLAEIIIPYEIYEFIIDLKNNNAYFEKKEVKDSFIDSLLNEECKNIFKKIHSFYTEELFSLNNININEIISAISNIKRNYKENPLIYCKLSKIVYYTIKIEYSNQEEEYISIYNDIPFELVDILKRDFGFDVFNLDNIKYLVTEKDYDISENNIYDKATGDKLILKKIDYSNEALILFESTLHSFHIDFNKKELKTINNEKITLSSEDIEKILFLIKKYGIFKWNSIEYSNKSINQIPNIFDGRSWRLSLVFDGGQVLNLGGHNAFHDTYLEFGTEINKLFGIELLDLSLCKRLIYKRDGKICGW